MAISGSMLRRSLSKGQTSAYDTPMAAAQPVDKPYEPPKPGVFKPYPGDWIRQRTIGINPLRSPIPGDIQSGDQARRYALVAKNPVVNAALNRRMIGAFRSQWDIEPCNDYKLHPEFEALDNEIIDLVNDQIRELEYESFTSVLKTIFWDSLVYGYSISEMIFNDSADAARRGEWRVIAIKPKVSFDFDFWADDVGNLDRIFYKPFGLFRIHEQLEKFVITTYPNRRDGNFYGTSALQSIIQDVNLLQMLEEFEAKGIQRLSVRPIMLWYAGDLSDTELENYQATLYDLNSSGLASFPMTVDPATGKTDKYAEVEVLEDRASADGIELTRAIIEMLQRRINHTLGTPNDVGFTSTESGSLAKADVESDQMTIASLFDNEFIESFVNRQIIPAMTVYNYSTFPDRYQLPKFRFSAVKEYYRNMESARTIELFKEGILDKDEVRDTMGLGPSTSTLPVTSGDPDGGEVAPMAEEGVITEAAVLNGAQITAATAIVQSVAEGKLPRDSGIAQIKIFFNLSEAQALEIMGSAGLQTLVSTAAPEPQTNAPMGF